MVSKIFLFLTRGQIFYSAEKFLGHSDQRMLKRVGSIGKRLSVLEGQEGGGGLTTYHHGPKKGYYQEL
jgi:hypothetical protein